MEALEAAVLSRIGGDEEEDKTRKLWREPLKHIADLENQEKRDALATSLVPLAKFFFSSEETRARGEFEQRDANYLQTLSRRGGEEVIRVVLAVRGREGLQV